MHPFSSKRVLPGEDEEDTDPASSLRDRAVAGEAAVSLAGFGLVEAELDAGWRAQAVTLAPARRAP